MRAFGGRSWGWGRNSRRSSSGQSLYPRRPAARQLCGSRPWDGVPAPPSTQPSAPCARPASRWLCKRGFPTASPRAPLHATSMTQLSPTYWNVYSNGTTHSTREIESWGHALPLCTFMNSLLNQPVCKPMRDSLPWCSHTCSHKDLAAVHASPAAALWQRAQELHRPELSTISKVSAVVNHQALNDSQVQLLASQRVRVSHCFPSLSSGLQRFADTIQGQDILQ